jgi:hypothetical protein
MIIHSLRKEAIDQLGSAAQGIPNIGVHLNV